MRRRRKPWPRRVRRALVARAAHADDVAQCRVQLELVADQFEGKGFAGDARLSWARLELADALKAFRTVDRRLGKLMRAMA